MTVLLMALLALPVGLLLDRWIAKLAREPFERIDDEEDDVQVHKREAAAIGTLDDENALDMPLALTTRAPYRRAVVVGATAFLFAIAGLQYGGDALHLALVASYVSALIVCAGTDVLAYRVPNVVTYPAILGALVIGMVMPDASKADVWAGGLITGGTFLVMCIATRGGMGMGDVKLAFFIGFALGLSLGIVAVLVTAISGGVIAVVLMVAGIRDRRDPIPYAPFIALGALYVLLTQGTAFTAL